MAIRFLSALNLHRKRFAGTAVLRNSILILFYSLFLLTVGFAGNIESSITESISGLEAFKDVSISIHNSNGIFQLVGNLNTEEQLNTLVELTMSKPGVIDVDLSKIFVNGAPVDMHQITVAKINGVLLREHFNENKDVIKPIEVFSTKNRIILMGIVLKRKELNLLLKLIHEIPHLNDEIESKVIVIEANRH